MGGLGSGRRPKGHQWIQGTAEKKWKKNMRTLVNLGIEFDPEMFTCYPEREEYYQYCLNHRGK